MVIAYIVFACLSYLVCRIGLQQTGRMSPEINYFYVLQAYQQVKDLRTNVESTNPKQVLDNDLKDFMTAVLAQDAVGKPRADLSQRQSVHPAASEG